MYLVTRLKQRIEAYWECLQLTEPFFLALHNGRLSPEMLHRFLVDVLYLVQHTPIHLNKAITHTERLGRQDLKLFFQQKLREEQDHDKWAENDIAKLNIPPTPQNPPPTASLAIQHLVRYIESLIEQDPYLYLPYIFFAEYLCVICGPEMTQKLEQKCSFPAGSITIIENHSELDQSHIEEWEKVVSNLVDEQIYSQRFLQTIDQTIAIHRNFLRNCGVSTTDMIEYARS